jgi:hypothetical protein
MISKDLVIIKVFFAFLGNWNWCSISFWGRFGDFSFTINIISTREEESIASEFGCITQEIKPYKLF